MDKYKNKFRIPSARLQGYNYANAGMYYITICTAGMRHYFGDVVQTQCIASVQLSPIGKIAHNEWFKTLEIRPDMNLQLGSFVVMPHHIHGIIIIGENDFNKNHDPNHGNSFSPQSKNIASIIRGYKSAVTRQARILDIEFGWQTRFYERVIRNNAEYNRISNYIDNNPQKWIDDRF